VPNDKPDLGRRLLPTELDVIEALVRAVPGHEHLADDLANARVVEMDDGGMGSLRFAPSDDRRREFGSEISSAEFADDDGVLVSLALYVDQFGELFELDSWKVNFEPLVRFPEARSLMNAGPFEGVKQRPRRR
jgi:hypothetical protein